MTRECSPFCGYEHSDPKEFCGPFGLLITEPIIMSNEVWNGLAMPKWKGLA